MFAFLFAALGDGGEDGRIAEINGVEQRAGFAEMGPQLFAVGDAIPFVRGDVGEDASGAEELEGAVVEIDVEVGGAGVGRRTKSAMSLPVPAHREERGRRAA